MTESTWEQRFDWMFNRQSPIHQDELKSFIKQEIEKAKLDAVLTELPGMLEKAREEGRQEVGVKVNETLSTLLVDLANKQIEQDNKICQEERQRILRLIEEFRQEGIIPLDERRQGWNQALEALKEKLCPSNVGVTKSME